MDAFELHDFIDDPNFDQFIDLIRGENEEQFGGTFDCPDYLLNGMLMDDQQFPIAAHDDQGLQTISGDVLQYNAAAATYNNDSSSAMMLADPFLYHDVPVALPTFEGNMHDDGEGEGEDYSSGTTTNTMNTTTTASGRKAKTDRSRTLISERSRRGRMKEKLYALRSLVPNITKMDKASIIGDAVLYVKELQMQAKKLKQDISSLEASIVGPQQYGLSVSSSNSSRRIQTAAANQNPVVKRIMQMDMFQVEEKGFYVRLVCNKGEGIAASLYKALESLTGFNVQNSNLTTAPDHQTYTLTFTLNVKESEHGMNLPNLKLWVTGALLNQGFELLTNPT